MSTLLTPFVAVRRSLANRLGGIAVSVLALSAAVARALRHRRAVGQLLDLDDRALRDIGLSRSDVHVALAMPVTLDPSLMLTVRAVDRRSRLRVTAPVRPGVRPRSIETVGL